MTMCSGLRLVSSNPAGVLGGQPQSQPRSNGQRVQKPCKSHVAAWTSTRCKTLWLWPSISTVDAGDPGFYSLHGGFRWCIDCTHLLTPVSQIQPGPTHLSCQAQGDAQQGSQDRRLHMELKKVHLAGLQNVLAMQAQLL